MHIENVVLTMRVYFQSMTQNHQGTVGEYLVSVSEYDDVSCNREKIIRLSRELCGTIMSSTLNNFGRNSGRTSTPNDGRAESDCT